MSQFKKDIIICTKITRLQYNLLTNYLINSNGEEGEGGGGGGGRGDKYHALDTEKP